MNFHPLPEMPEGGPEASGFVSNYLLYLLAAASDRLSAEFHAHVRLRGVRVPEWRILACLADQDGQIVTRLAALSLMEQSRLTKIIDQMADKKLVTRRSDARDRRRVRVFLTAAGRRLASELVEAARAHEANVMEPLAREDAETLKRVLNRIIATHGGGEKPSSHPSQNHEETTQ